MTKIKDLFHKIGPFAYLAYTLIIWVLFHNIPEALIGAALGPCVATAISLITRIRKMLAKYTTCQVRKCT